MQEVTATEFAKRFSQYRQAAQREPVAVTHHSRVTEVLMSKRDYDDYVRLRDREARAFWAHEMSPEMFEALAASQMDPRHNHLNALLSDDEPA